MKLTIKRKHLTEADPASPTGQPGKREQAHGKPTGSSGGSPTPLTKHVVLQPDDFHAHGQPHPGDPVLRKTGPSSHPTQNRDHKPIHSPVSKSSGGGAAHLTTGFRSHAAGMVVKQVRPRIGAPASHHRLRDAGQKVHYSGQATSGGPTKPYDGGGKPPRSPGHPEDTAQARLNDHLASGQSANTAHRGFGKTTQARVAKYGSKERFAKLRMTPKRDRGGAA